MQEIILTILLAVLGSSSLSTFALAFFNRKWAKQDKRNDKLDAIMCAQKVIMIDRVRYLGTSYIRAGQITLLDKENLTEMHEAYKKLGGNGHLDLVMSEVNKLKIVDERK